VADILNSAKGALGLNTDNEGFAVEPVSSAGGFAIEELSGDKRRVELQGRALPVGTFTLEGEMRAEFTYYPGNPIASAQVFGAKENETTVSGRWSDRHLKGVDKDGKGVEAQGKVLLNGNPAPNVVAAVDLIDDIRMRGQLVRVTWDTRTREGIIRRFKQTWHRAEIVEWEMAFEWISRGEKEIPVGFSPQPDLAGLGASMNRLTALLGSALDVVDRGFSLLAEVQSTIDSAMETIESAVSTVTDAIGLVDSAVSLPAQAWNKASGAIGTIIEECSSLGTYLDSLPSRAVFAGSDDDTISDLTLGDALKADAWKAGAKAAANALGIFATQQKEALRDAAEAFSDILDVFFAQQDTDLRAVSVAYYGTPDEWQRLMSFNGLASSRLTAGMEIVIPGRKGTT